MQRIYVKLSAGPIPLKALLNVGDDIELCAIRPDPEYARRQAVEAKKDLRHARNCKRRGTNKARVSEWVQSARARWHDYLEFRES